jgi:hypothetical protein
MVCIAGAGNNRALQRTDIPALSTQVIDVISMSDDGSNLLAGGNRVAPLEIRCRIPQAGVTELIKHHKVAAAASQR